LRQRLRELAGERRRFGYRRLGYLLSREGMMPNHKKLLRLYREEGLRVRRRGGDVTPIFHPAMGRVRG
jgi:putative transposase